MDWLKSNLLAGLKLALFRRVLPEEFRVTLDQAVVLSLLNLALGILADYFGESGAVRFSWYAFSFVGFYLVLFLFASYVIGRLISRQMLLEMLVYASASAPLFYGLAILIALFYRFDAFAHYVYYVHWIAYAWSLLVLFSCLRLASSQPRIKLAPLWMLFLAISVLPQIAFSSADRFWYAKPNFDYAAPAARVNAEEVFYTQPAMLSNLKSSLAPQRPGITDLYFVAFAGDGSQDVFMKEAKSVKELFDTRFGTRTRSLALINNPKTVKEFGIASVSNLGAVLTHLGTVMDAEEDILFLFLTSHGSKKGLAVEFWPLDLNPLPQATLRSMLAATPIKWKVLVVSACYSGVFLEQFKDPYTLIITAAGSDRTSFGCSNEAERTYFGEAFFENGLRQHSSFIAAFKAAAIAIAAREKTEKLPASNPQIYFSSVMENKLKQWETQQAEQNQLHVSK